MQNFETRNDLFIFLGPVSHPKEDHKGKAIPPSGGAGKYVLWQKNLENIRVQLQNTPTYYIKYKEEEDKSQSTDKSNTRRRSGISGSQRREKIYIKQQLLKDSFEVNRYSKGLLVHIKKTKCIKY